MKTANEMPLYSPQRFLQISQGFLGAQVLYAGIDLGLFDRLQTPKTALQLAEETAYHPRNLELLLHALTATSYLEKKDGRFCNKKDTDYYLNSASSMCIAEHLLYWREMTSLQDIASLVKEGPPSASFQDQNGSDFFDFRSMGQGARNVLYATEKIQTFIAALKSHLPADKPLRVLDMGCGSGIYGIEIARNFPLSKIIAFDQPHVIPVTQKNIEEYGVSSQVEAVAGNFVTDELGENYDLIIASGVLDFVGDVGLMAQKLRVSLCDHGYLYAHTHGIKEDFSGPAPFVLGWLSSHLHGLDILKSDPVIRSAFEAAGFKILPANDSSHEYWMRKNLP